LLDLADALTKRLAFSTDTAASLFDVVKSLAYHDASTHAGEAAARAAFVHMLLGAEGATGGDSDETALLGLVRRAAADGCASARKSAARALTALTAYHKETVTAGVFTTEAVLAATVYLLERCCAGIPRAETADVEAAAFAVEAVSTVLRRNQGRSQVRVEETSTSLHVVLDCVQQVASAAACLRDGLWWVFAGEASHIAQMCTGLATVRGLWPFLFGPMATRAKTAMSSGTVSRDKLQQRIHESLDVVCGHAEADGGVDTDDHHHDLWLACGWSEEWCIGSDDHHQQNQLAASPWRKSLVMWVLAEAAIAPEVVNLALKENDPGAGVHCARRAPVSAVLSDAPDVRAKFHAIVSAHGDDDLLLPTVVLMTLWDPDVVEEVITPTAVKAFAEPQARVRLVAHWLGFTTEAGDACARALAHRRMASWHTRLASRDPSAPSLDTRIGTAEAVLAFVDEHMHHRRRALTDLFDDLALSEFRAIGARHASVFVEARDLLPAVEYEVRALAALLDVLGTRGLALVERDVPRGPCHASLGCGIGNGSTGAAAAGSDAVDPFRVYEKTVTAMIRHPAGDVNTGSAVTLYVPWWCEPLPVPPDLLNRVAPDVLGPMTRSTVALAFGSAVGAVDFAALKTALGGPSTLHFARARVYIGTHNDSGGLFSFADSRTTDCSVAGQLGHTLFAMQTADLTPYSRFLADPPELFELVNHVEQLDLPRTRTYVFQLRHLPSLYSKDTDSRIVAVSIRN
jgi:hypothetical protein